MHRVLERQLRKLGISDGPPNAEQWKALLERIDCVYTAADQDRYTLERSLDLSSSEMKKRFGELRTAQAQLVEASRKAGMADVATSVLHNIGNVLNSVNVSAQVITEIVRGSAASRLGKTLDLLGTQPQPGKFIDEDARGKKVLPFLAGVDRTLKEERERTIAEIESLTKALEHIKATVAMQLSLARGDRHRSMIETVVLDELTRSAASMLDSGTGIRIAFENEEIALKTDRHKLLGIVTNLIVNARDSVNARGGGLIMVRTRKEECKAVLEVVDDGLGISSEDLQRIFSHGFTTKPNGHGFGLHASACAAMELGGTLTAISEGLGRGATFTITLPLAAAKRTAA